MKTSTIFLSLYIFFVIGCASTHAPFATEAELAEAPVFNRYEIPLNQLSFESADVEQIMREAVQAVGDSETRAWSGDDLAKIGRYLCLCKWAFGYRGKSVQVTLIGGGKSLFREGAIYLCVKNSAHYRAAVLAHEFGGHATEERTYFSLFDPASWFGPPSKVVTNEVRGEMTVPIFFRRLNVYSGWNPVPELRFFPLDEIGEPELWNFFILKEGEANPKAKTFVEKLREVRNYQELEAFCGNQEKPEWGLVWLCCILLEAHHRDPEAVWAFLDTADDGVLEQEINKILRLMPADFAVQQFTEQRKALFR